MIIMIIIHQRLYSKKVWHCQVRPVHYRKETPPNWYRAPYVISFSHTFTRHSSEPMGCHDKITLPVWWVYSPCHHLSHHNLPHRFLSSLASIITKKVQRILNKNTRANRIVIIIIIILSTLYQKNSSNRKRSNSNNNNIYSNKSNLDDARSDQHSCPPTQPVVSPSHHYHLADAVHSVDRMDITISFHHTATVNPLINTPWVKRSTWPPHRPLSRPSPKKSHCHVFRHTPWHS